MGIKVVGAWNTAYSAVDTLIPFDSETLTQNYNRIQDMSLLGSAGRNQSDQGVQMVSGQTVHRLDYNNFDALLELFFGSLSSRVLTLTDDTLPHYCYIELEKSVSRWRFGPCKATKVAITGEKDGHVMLTIDWIARDVERVATAFPALSVAGARNLIRFEDMLARFETVASGPPGAGDELRIESFELEIDRGLVPDDFASKSTVANEEKLALEPIPNQFREATFKIKLPRYDSDAKFPTWKDADTAIQADLTFTRSGETMVVDLPLLKIVGGHDSPVGGPERIQNEVEMELYKPDGSNPLYTGNEARITFT